MSDLSVITKSKDLCSYIMTVTQKSPKQFRFSFVGRLQNLSLSVIENLYRANDTYIQRGDDGAIRWRADYQREAITELRIHGYIALLEEVQRVLGRYHAHFAHGNMYLFEKHKLEQFVLVGER